MFDSDHPGQAVLFISQQIVAQLPIPAGAEPASLAAPRCVLWPASEGQAGARGSCLSPFPR